jgi:hypothetical protein
MLRYGLIALIAITFPAAADIYKWVDEKGEVHYSDQPPASGGAVEKYLKESKPAQPRPDATPAESPKSEAEEEMAFRKRQAERDRAEAEQQMRLEQAETKRKNCEQARNNLAGLQAHSRVTKFGPNGEIEYLTDDEIEGAIVEAQATVNSWCQ